MRGVADMHDPGGEQRRARESKAVQMRRELDEQVAAKRRKEAAEKERQAREEVSGEEGTNNQGARVLLACSRCLARLGGRATASAS